MSRLFKVAVAAALFEVLVAVIVATAVLAGAWSHQLLWVALPVIGSTAVVVITAAKGDQVATETKAQIAAAEERVCQKMASHTAQLLTIIGHYVHDEERTTTYLAQLRNEDKATPGEVSGNVVRLPRR